jgi:HEAT repeat protein
MKGPVLRRGPGLSAAVAALAPVVLLGLAATTAVAAPEPATPWNPPGIAAPARPPELAPWPPRDPAAREAWAEIAMLEDSRATDLGRLVGLLQSSPDPLVRWRACRAFARLQDSTVVSFLLDALHGDADPSVRREAAFALGQVGPPARTAATALALAAREQPDRGVRARALEALGKIGERSATGALTAHLTHPEAELSREAAIACWRLGDSTAVPFLARALESRDAWTRAFAAYALEKTPMPAIAVRPLARLVSDPEIVVRAYAARALGRQRSPEALGPLVALAGDRDPRVRVSAVRAMGALADSAALPQVLAALGDADPHVRETAAAAAPGLASRDAVPALRRALADRDGGVRLAAARALAALAPETAYADLTELLADSERFVRAGVYEALGRVPGPEPLLTVRRVAAGIRPIGGSASAEERASAFSGLAAVPGRREGRDEILAGLNDGHWLVAASAAEAAGASGDSTLVPELTRLLRRNPDPREVDVPLGVLGAVGTLGAGAARGPGAAGLRAALDSVLADPDPRLRAAAEGAYRAVFGDSAVAGHAAGRLAGRARRAGLDGRGGPRARRTPRDRARHGRGRALPARGAAHGEELRHAGRARLVRRRALPSRRALLRRPGRRSHGHGRGRPGLRVPLRVQPAALRHGRAGHGALGQGHGRLAVVRHPRAAAAPRRPLHDLRPRGEGPGRGRHDPPRRRHREGHDPPRRGPDRRALSAPRARAAHRSAPLVHRFSTVPSTVVHRARAFAASRAIIFRRGIKTC